MQHVYMFLRRLFPTNDRFALWNEYGIAGEWTAVAICLSFYIECLQRFIVTELQQSILRASMDRECCLGIVINNALHGVRYVRLRVCSLWDFDGRYIINGTLLWRAKVLSVDL